MWLFLLFIGVPLVEIALFVQVGGWLTLWPTLAIVVATAVAGAWLVRRQGLAALADLRNAAQGFGNPASTLADGALILVAGMLLLTPGFFTDTMALLLLVPAVRRRVLSTLARRIVVLRDRSAARDIVIDADYREIEPGAPHRSRH
ncbi:MAG: FxsA family protein [Gemmobacter sp.]